MSAQLTREELLDRLESMEDRLADLEEQNRRQAEELAAANRRITDVEDENEQLRAKQAEIRSRVDPDPTNKEYANLTREQKVHQVRVALARQAVASANGKARYTYRDVLAQYESRPSPGHAYTLLEIAGEADGFRYGDHNGEKSLLVNLDAVNDDAVIHAVNNGTDGEEGKR